MKNYCIFRFEKHKTKGTVTSSLKHTFREITTTNADSKVQNEILKGGSTSKDVMKDYNSRLKEIMKDKKIRKNAVVAIETIQTFSPEQTKNIDLDKWKKDNLLYLENTFGKENVISVVLHLDETTPHITSIILPIDDKNKLNCREVTKRENLIKYQDEYAKYMQKYALKRGERGSKIKHKPPKKFYSELNKVEDNLGKDKQFIDDILKDDSIPKRKLFESDKSFISKIEEHYRKLTDICKKLITSNAGLRLDKNSLIEKNKSLLIRLKNKENSLNIKDREISNLLETINQTPVLTKQLNDELLELRKYRNKELLKKFEKDNINTEKRKLISSKENKEDESQSLRIR